ncbi:MAG: UbiA family prenyltransferase [Bacteroidia bacterium]
MFFRKPIYYFVFGNFLIAFSSVGLTHLSQLGKELTTGDLHLLVFVFFSTLLVYNLNLIEGMKGLKSSAFRSVRHNWIVKHEKFIWAFSVLSLIVSVAELTALSKDTLIFLLVPGLFALGYAVPIRLPGMKTIRLRELPFVKIFLVAWVWATFTVGLPLVQQSGLAELLQPKNFLLFFSRAVFIFAITIPFDIRDLAYDSDKHVATIPSRFGAEKSKYFSLVLLLVFVASSFVRCNSGFCNMNEFIALTISALVSAALVLMVNSQRKELFYSLGIESTMIIQWTLVLLSTII